MYFYVCMYVCTYVYKRKTWLFEVGAAAVDLLRQGVDMTFIRASDKNDPNNKHEKAIACKSVWKAAAGIHSEEGLGPYRERAL